MNSPKLVDMYLKVKNVDRAINFCEAFLGVPQKAGRRLRNELLHPTPLMAGQVGLGVGYFLENEKGRSVSYGDPTTMLA